MVLRPKRPTLAKTALEWGTLKFHYARTRRWATAGPLLQHRKHPVDFKGQSRRENPKTHPQVSRFARLFEKYEAPFRRPIIPLDSYGVVTPIVLQSGPPVEFE